MCRAADLYVVQSYGGTPSGDEGSATNPITGSDGIATAIPRASSGDTIYVGGGTYYEFSFPALEDPPIELSIIAHNWNQYTTGDAIIDGTGRNQSTGVTIAGGHTEESLFSGFIVQDWEPPGSGGCGIRIGPTPNNADGIGCSPRIEGCLISNNTSEGLSNYGGAGMQIGWSCHPTVTSCVFEGNAMVGSSTGYGGALWIYGTGIGGSACDAAEPPLVMSVPDPVIEYCTFLDNTATNTSFGSGGAIAINCAKSTIRNCTFSGNAASHAGGAIYGKVCDGTLIEGCVFEGGNTAELGGAVYFLGTPADDAYSGVDLIGNAYFENSATVSGGAIYIVDKGALISHSWFGENVAGTSGGAVWFGGERNVGSPTTTESPYAGQLVCCLFAAENEVSGSAHPHGHSVIYVAQGSVSERVECSLVNSTIADNPDLRAITLNNAQVDETDRLQFGCFNSILFSNSNSLSENSIHESSYATTLIVAYTNAEQEVFSGDGNLSEEPLFASEPSYSLDSGSPCIDAGDDDYWVPVFYPDYDIKASTRIAGAAIDMGCYEL